MARPWVPLLGIFLNASAVFAQQIVWDSATLTLIQAGGVYGRMVRLPDREILCSFEWNGAIYVRRSADEGSTWSDAVQAASYDFGTPANPEMLVLQNGWVLLAYNERPSDGVHPYTIKVGFSQDGGHTWGGYSLVYQAGSTADTGCWEPAALQLPAGEIQLYFSNEAPYGSTGEQEITLVRSFDNGATWTAPERASFRPGHRDGMPVPLALNDGSGVVLSIEDNGLSGTFKPAVVSPPTATRWAALVPDLPAPVYAGAPYLRQFPSGETVLSLQSGDGRSDPGTLNFSQMAVYVGDDTAHGFTNVSLPFAVPAGSNGLWNSLFIKNAVTVTAISGTTIGGVAGLWAIDGRLEYQGAPPAPAVESVTNVAGGPAGPVAPGEFVSIAGSGLAPANSQPMVSFGGVPSPLAYVAGDQINALVPYGVSQAADVVVSFGGGSQTYPYPLGVAASAPEIFTQADGTAQAVAVNQDGSLNAPGSPAARGSYLSFWATGQGQVQQSGGYRVPVLPVQASLGGVEAPVSFAGLIDAGVMQVNIQVPAGAPAGGAVPLVLTVGSGVSRTAATVAVQ